MRVAVYQPQYFPRLHYINRILDADAFVLLESAQYTPALTHHTESGRERHKSYQSHAPIKLPDGPYLLTVSTQRAGRRTPINQTRVQYEEPWPSEHLKSLQRAYGKAGHFGQHFPQVQALLEQRYPSLADLDLSTILWALNELLELEIPFEALDLDAVNERLASQRRTRLRGIVRDTGLDAKRPPGRQKGTEWNVAICTELGADEYLYGGTAAASYMDKERFAEHGISLVQQAWHCSEYSQRHTRRQGFVANLSILDLLLNVDAGTALDVVWPR